MGEMRWRVTAATRLFRAKVTVDAYWAGLAMDLAYQEFKNLYLWGRRDASGRLYRPPEIRNPRAALALAAGMLALTAAVTGCNGTNHDALNPTVDIVVKWWRMETPPGFQTIMFGCYGTTGMYLDQGDGNLSQVENDPMCPKDGTPYQLEQRHGSDPAVPVGTYNMVPPDSTGQYQAINGKP